MNFTPLKSGVSVEGDEILAYRSEEKPKVQLHNAGVHGMKWKVYLLQELFKWLQDEELSIPLIVIPILNVDGYRSQTRVNAHGVDLNRNLPSSNWTQKARDDKYHPGESALSEPENKYLVKLFEKYPPKFILTLHSWKPMLNYNGDDCEKYAKVIHQHNNYPKFHIEGHQRLALVNIAENYDAQVLTFEAPLISEDKSLKTFGKKTKRPKSPFAVKSTVIINVISYI